MRVLEQHLGVRLFARSGRGVVLTEAGARLRDFARTSLRDFDELRQSLALGSAAPRVLRLASVSVFGRYVLFPHLRKSNRFVELRFPTQDEVLQRVASGAVDAGFIYEPRVRSALSMTAVATEELVLVTPARGENAVDRVALADVVAKPFVTWDEYEYVFGRWFQSAFGKQPPGALQVVAHFEEMEEVLAWVADGHGISIVPRDCAAGSEVVQHLRLRSARRRCTNEIFAVWRADRQRDDVMTLLRELSADTPRRRRTSRYS